MSMHKKVAKLAAPSVVNMLLLTVISYTDTFVISRFGADAVSGSSIVMAVWGLLYATTALFSSGEQVLLTRFIGAKSYQKASIVISTLLISATVVSIVLALVFYYLPTMILALLDTSISVIDYAVAYGHILVLDIPFIFIDTVVDTALISYGNTKMPMYLAIVAAVVNVILDFAFGFGYFGFPNMGVVGVALSTVISYMIIALLHLYLFFGNKMPYSASIKFSARVLKRVLEISIPQVSSRFITVLSNILFGSAIITLGSKVYAGYSLAISAMSLAYMPGFAFASAGSILLGQEIGAKQYVNAIKYVEIAFKYAFVVLVGVGALFWVFAKEIAEFFSTDPEVVTIIVLSIRVFSLAQIPFAVDIVYTFAINGAGLTKKSFKINTLTLWIFRIIPAMVGIYIFNSYNMVLGAFFIQFLATAYFMYREFYKYRWVRLKV
jgi:putative MATE family efflux protein